MSTAAKRKRGESNKSSGVSRQLVHSLNEHDVVLGRGQHVKHVGNDTFRSIVRARAVEYTSCCTKTGKDIIARQIVQAVRAQGGRFVKRISSYTAAEANLSEPQPERSVDPMSAVWEIVDEATVLVKVKQTFRDYSVVVRKSSGAAAAPAAVTHHDPVEPTIPLASQVPTAPAAQLPILAQAAHAVANGIGQSSSDLPNSQSLVQQNQNGLTEQILQLVQALQQQQQHQPTSSSQPQQLLAPFLAMSSSSNTATASWPANNATAAALSILSQQRWAPPPVPHSLTNSAYHHLLHAPSLLNRPFLSDPQQQQLQQLPALGSSQTASAASPFTGATTTQSLSWPLSLDEATLARLQWSAVLPNAQFGSSTTLDISTLLAQTAAAASSNSSSMGQAPPPLPSNSDNATASEAAPSPGATQQEA
jgi:hypothetical protein